MNSLRKLYNFVHLQVILWHSDKWTNWYRLRLRYEPEKTLLAEAGLDTIETSPPNNPPVIPETLE